MQHAQRRVAAARCSCERAAPRDAATTTTTTLATAPPLPGTSNRRSRRQPTTTATAAVTNATRARCGHSQRRQQPPPHTAAAAAAVVTGGAVRAVDEHIQSRDARWRTSVSGGRHRCRHRQRRQRSVDSSERYDDDGIDLGDDGMAAIDGAALDGGDGMYDAADGDVDDDLVAVLAQAQP